MLYTLLGTFKIMGYDWILFVFKSSNNVKYLVAAESEDDAWSQLRSRQSIGMELLKKQYKLRGTMNGGRGVWKVK